MVSAGVAMGEPAGGTGFNCFPPMFLGHGNAGTHLLDRITYVAKIEISCCSRPSTQETRPCLLGQARTGPE